MPGDLLELQKVITTFYLGANGVLSQHIRESFFSTKKAAVLSKINDSCETVKIRFDSQDLNSDMLRVTYMQNGESILFIELYSKSQKNREDQERIAKYTKQLKS